MFNVKYRFEAMPFYDCDRIATHLEAMASKGWMIEKISGQLYKYRRSEPVQLRFAVTYFPENTNYELYPTPQQEHYLDICRAEGWQSVFLHNQMQVLSNENPDAVDIETEGETQLDNIHTTAKKTFIKNYLASIFLAILQIITAFIRFKTNPLDFIATPVNLLAPLAFTVFSVSAMVQLTDYLLWYTQCRNNINDTGQFLQPREHKFSFAATQLVPIAIWLMVMAVYISGSYRKYLIAALFVAAVSTAIPKFLMYDAKQMGRSAGDVQFIGTVSCVVAVLVSMYCVTSPGIGVAKLDKTGSYYMREYALSYFENTDIVMFNTITLQEAEKYPELIPLTIHDYNPYVTAEGEIRYRIEADTWLVETQVIHQIENAKLSYYSYYPAEMVYDVALWGVKQNIPDLYTLQQVDAFLWQADKVWQVNDEKGYFAGMYIIAYTDRITQLTLDSGNMLSEQQTVIMAERLNKQQLKSSVKGE